MKRQVYFASERMYIIVNLRGKIFFSIALDSLIILLSSRLFVCSFWVWADLYYMSQHYSRNDTTKPKQAFLLPLGSIGTLTVGEASCHISLTTLIPLCWQILSSFQQSALLDIYVCESYWKVLSSWAFRWDPSPGQCLQYSLGVDPEAESSLPGCLAVGIVK